VQTPHSSPASPRSRRTCGCGAKAAAGITFWSLGWARIVDNMVLDVLRETFSRSQALLCEIVWAALFQQLPLFAHPNGIRQTQHHNRCFTERSYWELLTGVKKLGHGFTTEKMKQELSNINLQHSSSKSIVIIDCQQELTAPWKPEAASTIHFQIPDALQGKACTKDKGRRLGLQNRWTMDECWKRPCQTSPSPKGFGPPLPRLNARHATKLGSITSNDT